MKSLSILFVDDDKFLLDMYALKFSKNGFDVHTAQGPEEALKIVRDGLKIDILLLDVVMPGMDGIQFLEELKKRNIQGIKHIVILSNLGQKEDVDRGMNAGAQEYIVKANCTPSEVVARVNTLLGAAAK